MPDERRLSQNLMSYGLVLAALACAAWSAWPHLFPASAAPQVTRTALPTPTAQDPAPIYPATASVQPFISGRLNLNAATREQLEALPKIGPALAARLMEGRPYRSLADLDRVKGVGPKLLEALAPLVTF